MLKMLLSFEPLFYFQLQITGLRLSVVYEMLLIEENAGAVNANWGLPFRLLLWRRDKRWLLRLVVNGLLRRNSKVDCSRVPELGSVILIIKRSFFFRLNFGFFFLLFTIRDVVVTKLDFSNPFLDPYQFICSF